MHGGVVFPGDLLPHFPPPQSETLDSVSGVQPLGRPPVPFPRAAASPPHSKSFIHSLIHSTTKCLRWSNGRSHSHGVPVSWGACGQGGRDGHSPGHRAGVMGAAELTDKRVERRVAGGTRRDFRQAGQGRPLQAADLRRETRIPELEEESCATGKGTASAKALKGPCSFPPGPRSSGSCMLTSAAILPTLDPRGVVLKMDLNSPAPYLSRDLWNS